MAKSKTLVLALERIQTLRNILYDKGIDLLLPNLEETSDVKLEAVVNAFNSITKAIVSRVSSEVSEDANPIIVDKNSHVVIPSGYLLNEVIVTGSNSEQDIADAVAAAELVIKLAIAENVSLDKVLSTGKTYVKLEDGSYKLESGNITVHEETLIEVPINILKTTGETIVTSSYVPEGYYSEATTKLAAVLTIEDDPENKVINIEETKEVNTIQDNYIINPSDGYDYIKSVKINQGSADIAVSIDKNTVTLSKNVVEGWIKDINITGDNVSADGDSITVTIPSILTEDGEELVSEVTIGEDQVVTIIPKEGYYDGKTSILLTDDDENPIKVITATPEVVANEEETAYEIVVPKGLNLEEKTLTLNKASVDVVKSVDGDTISASVTLSEGYTEGSENAFDITSWIDENLAEEAEFNYSDILSEENATISVSGKRYFTSAKVDLSDLLDTIDNL